MCIFVGVYELMHVQMYVYMSTGVSVCIWVTHVCKVMRIYVYVCTCACVCLYALAYECVHIRVHVLMHARVHVCMCAPLGLQAHGTSTMKWRVVTET